MQLKSCRNRMESNTGYKFTMLLVLPDFIMPLPTTAENGGPSLLKGWLFNSFPDGFPNTFLERDQSEA